MHSPHGEIRRSSGLHTPHGHHLNPLRHHRNSLRHHWNSLRHHRNLRHHRGDSSVGDLRRHFLVAGKTLLLFDEFALVLFELILLGLNLTLKLPVLVLEENERNILKKGGSPIQPCFFSDLRLRYLDIRGAYTFTTVLKYLFCSSNICNYLCSVLDLYRLRVAKLQSDQLLVDSIAPIRVKRIALVSQRS